jgi:cellulose synthase/poly-beta-1,6-N-acetylglucosamine synthase-like glycosyltransferase
LLWLILSSKGKIHFQIFNYRWNQLNIFKRSALISSLSLPLGLLAEINFRRLKRLPTSNPDCSFPSLSIIIPARDEMHNLKHVLPSLTDIYCPGEFETLVVDDHSSDGTSRVAESYGVRVLRLSRDLPSGWKGKPYAFHQGALIAKGDWLLFTDADTIHTKGGIARSVCYAENFFLDGLSLFLDHKATSWTSSLALDAAFAGLFAGWSSKSSVLNGQFILVRREAYFESGGFASVRNEALEDIALGNLLAKLGYHLPLMRGDDIAGVQMYTSHRQMFNGLSRLGSGIIRWQGLRSGLTALHVAALVSPIITLIGVLFGRLRWHWLPITWSISTLSLFPWSHRSGAWKLALLAPIGAFVVIITAIYGLINRILGIGVVWKGRKV